MNRKLLASGIIGTLVAVPVVVGTVGHATGSVALQRAFDPFDLIRDRSPGSRAPGALFSTKPNLPKPTKIPSVPRPQTIDEVPVPLSLIGQSPIISGELGVPPVSLFSSIPGISQIDGSNGVIGGGFYPGGGGVGVGVPGTPSNPTNPTNPTNPPTDVPVPSIPEPSTWTTMLVGFFIMARWIRKASNRRLTYTHQ